jgi:hypothetical protein
VTALFATLFVSSLIASSALAPQPPLSPPRYRVTVYTIRPIAKRLPSQEELANDLRKWCNIEGFVRSPQVLTNDDGLLKYLRAHNPHVTIPSITEKQSALINSDEVGRFRVRSGTVNIRVCSRDRVQVIERHWKSAAQTDRARLSATASTTLIVHIGAVFTAKLGSRESQATFDDYHALPPGATSLLGPGLRYGALRERGDTSNAPLRLKQLVTDVVLIKVTPLRPPPVRNGHTNKEVVR